MICKAKIKSLLSTAILLLSAVLFLPAQESITISLSQDTIRFNETATVTLTGTVRDFHYYAELPSSDGFYATDNLTSMSYSVSNQLTQISQSFTLQPQKAGTFYVGKAWIQSGSRRIFSNQLKLTILPPEEPEAAKNFFIQAVPAKKTVYAGEPLEVNVWAYCAAGNSFEPSSDAPEADAYNGFWHYDGDYSESVPYEKKTISIKGKTYIGFPVYREILFPNTTGRISLPVYSYYCTVRNTPFRSADYYYDDYYLDGTETEVERRSDSAFIEVQPLPADGRPKDFRGDIGSFFIEATIDKTEVKAYEQVTITVTLSGAGNIAALQIPDPAFPAGFEHFAPATEYQNTISDQGIIGTKTFTYKVIPTKEGSYTIDSLSFTYYDLSRKKYMVTKARSFALKVNPGQPPQDPTIDNNLPDGFLSPESPMKKVFRAFLWILIPLAVLIPAFIWWMRKRKKREAERKAGEPDKKAPELPPGHEFRLMLRNAEMLFGQRNIKGCMNLLYDAVHSAISKKCELDRSEASASQLRYRLSTKKFSEEEIELLSAFVERCSVTRYAWASQNPESVRKMLAEAASFMTKLGY